MPVEYSWENSGGKATWTTQVDVIEAGFLFQVLVILIQWLKSVRLLHGQPSVRWHAVVEKDIDVAAESLKFAANTRRIHTGIGTSDSHIKYKFNSTVKRIIERAVCCCEICFKSTLRCWVLTGMLVVRITNIWHAWSRLSLQQELLVVNIPDTTGYCLPDDYGAKIKYLMEHVDNVDKAVLSTPLSQWFGYGYQPTHSTACWMVPVKWRMVNGIGEAGNTSLEEIAMILKCHKYLGIDTNINTTKIYTRSAVWWAVWWTCLFNLTRPSSVVMRLPIQAVSIRMACLKNTKTTRLWIPKRMLDWWQLNRMTARSVVRLWNIAFMYSVEVNDELKLDKLIRSSWNWQTRRRKWMTMIYWCLPVQIRQRHMLWNRFLAGYHRYGRKECRKSRSWHQRTEVWRGFYR